MERPCGWPRLYLEINGNDDELSLFDDQSYANLVTREKFMFRILHRYIITILEKILFSNQYIFKLTYSVKTM